MNHRFIEREVTEEDEYQTEEARRSEIEEEAKSEEKSGRADEQEGAAMT